MPRNYYNGPGLGSRRVLSMSVESWDDAVCLAQNENGRVNKTTYAIEYQEQNSPDQMCFYEVGDATHVAMLAQNYIITRTLRVG